MLKGLIAASPVLPITKAKALPCAPPGLTRPGSSLLALDFADSPMITYLKVRNLAIVEEFAIEPGPGLNVLTGETGAGKTLLIDSLEFLRGARGSSETIRSGAEKMSAEALFHLPNGDEVIVKRDIAISGRGRALMNGSLVS